MLVAGADSPRRSATSSRCSPRMLAEARRRPRMHVYDGAPHSFFDRSFAQWADACTDAWNRIISFTTRHRH